MWMNKSLKYGILIIPYWPMKAWWSTRKFAKMIFFMDIPVAPEGHPNARIVRSYIFGGYTLPAEVKVVAEHKEENKH